MGKPLDTQAFTCLTWVVRAGLDLVFRALADPSRRALLDSLNARNGQTLRELCAGLDMARQSVSKHLAVLEEAGLVATVRRGREKLHYLNAAPVHEIAHRWISRYWATEFTTDWSVGSPMTSDNHGVLISDPEQVVLEAEPYSRLSYTWHAITPELAKRFGWDEELLARLSGEARSKVTFTIEEHRGRAERHPEAAVPAVGAHGVAPLRLLEAARHPGHRR